MLNAADLIHCAALDHMTTLIRAPTPVHTVMVLWFRLNCVKAEQKPVRCFWRSESRSRSREAQCPD